MTAGPCRHDGDYRVIDRETRKRAEVDDPNAVAICLRCGEEFQP